MMAAETPSSIKNQNISGTKQAVMQMLNNASAHSLEESNTSNLVVKKNPLFYFFSKYESYNFTIPEPKLAPKPPKLKRI